MKKQSNKIKGPSWQEIAKLAYEIYEKEGRPEGRTMEHWLQAEWLLKARLAEEAGQDPENY